MNEDKNYVLGTHDEEIERLGLQHRVWRPTVLQAWSDAGVTEGSRVVDLGCGPGYATVDLAEIVGASGAVLGVERSARFLDSLRAECGRRRFGNVQLLEADLTEAIKFPRSFDAVWCRWVACFLPDLTPLITHLDAALRPGGMAIFHEYVDYSTWQSIPKIRGIETFVAEVMKSWRAAGGEPDIAPALISRLIAAGFEIEQARPIIFAVRPCDFMWRWPGSFIRSHARRLAAQGQTTEQWATSVLAEFDRLEQASESIMLTPTLLQILARKR